MHSVIDTDLSPATRFDAETLHRTAGNVLWLAFICTKICIDIFLALKDIRPIASKWPMQEEQHHLLTKTDILNTLPPHTKTMDPGTICLFCRDHHTEPLDLPCDHIYCKPCVETLIEYGHNKCGPCRRQYYKLNDVAPTIQLQQQAAFAKRVLTTHFKYWALAAIYLLASSIHWHLLDSSSSARPIGCRIVCAVDAVLCRTAYYGALQLIKRDLKYVKAFGEEWWSTLESNGVLQRQEWFVELLLQCGMILAVTMFQLAGQWHW